MSRTFSTLGLAIAVLAGGAARGQGVLPTVAGATVSYELSFEDINGVPDGILEPGESARLHLTIAYAPPSGTTVQVGTPPVPMELRAFWTAFLDLVGSGGAEGIWSNLQVDPGWDLFGAPGTSAMMGANLLNVHVGQFVGHNPLLINSTNPVVSIWEGTWSPLSYDSRTVTFRTATGTANPQPAANSFLLRSPQTPTLIFAGAGADLFGQVTIPIIPAPSTLALLGLGLLAAGRPPRPLPI